MAAAFPPPNCGNAYSPSAVSGCSKELRSEVCSRSRTPASRLSSSPRASGQSTSDAVCDALKGSGARTSSSRSGTSIPRSSPSVASARHHRDWTELSDQATTRQRAESNSVSIVSSKLGPAIRLRSHQTDQPSATKTLTKGSTRSRSSVAYEKRISATSAPSTQTVLGQDPIRVLYFRTVILHDECHGRPRRN